jgi:hypothetical protein
MELIVRIVPKEDNSHFAVECDKCGWIGSSADVNGGGQIGQSGDHFDITCPCCNSLVEETNNEQMLTGFMDRLIKANNMVKLLTDQMDGYDTAKYNHTRLEEENKAMAKELYELKNKQ